MDFPISDFRKYLLHDLLESMIFLFIRFVLFFLYSAYSESEAFYTHMIAMMAFLKRKTISLFKYFQLFAHKKHIKFSHWKTFFFIYVFHLRDSNR